ncbi:hypothetical protein Neosp_006590 [[Neocosmospora] mangrovei]
MALSRRYNASKKKGKGQGQSKKATTVNEGGRGGNGNQSTDLNSPRKTRAGPKISHRPRTRRAITIEPEDIEEE